MALLPGPSRMRDIFCCRVVSSALILDSLTSRVSACASVWGEKDVLAGFDPLEVEG